MGWLQFGFGVAVGLFTAWLIEAEDRLRGPSAEQLARLWHDMHEPVS